MFSPITARSLKIRLLYTSLYTLLILGALTMIIPFLIMITGSLEPRSQGRNAVFPAWLIDRDELWNRYLETKYRGIPDFLRMAWGDSKANFLSNRPVNETNAHLALWEEFVREAPPPSSPIHSVFFAQMPGCLPTRAAPFASGCLTSTETISTP